MLIDVNAYVGHWPFIKLKYSSCADLLQRMNQYGIDISVVSNINAIFYKNTQSGNEELYNEIKADKKLHGRIVPFAVINPVYGAWKDDLKICITKLGMKGIRIYPHYHDFDITEAPVIELVKMARDYGVPVALPVRMVDSRQRSWMDVQKEWQLKEFMPLVQAVPDAKYMFLNIATGFGVSAAESALLKKTDYLFDMSGRNMQYMSQLLSTFGKEHFAFGTQAPILDYLTAQLRIETLRPAEATEADKELMRSGNARRFLNL